MSGLKEHCKPGSEFRRSIKYNILFAVCIASVLIVAETLYRMSNQSLRNLMLPREYIDIVVILFLLSFFAYKRFILIFVCFLAVFMCIQMVHYSFFGAWLLPIELFLFFPKYTEVFATFKTVLGMLVLPLLLCTAGVMLVTAVHRRTEQRVVSKYASVAIILLLLLPVVRVAFFNKKLGTKPNEDKSIQKNTVYCVSCFLGKTLPCLVFDMHKVRKWKHGSYPVRRQKQDTAALVLIIGESLTSSHMSLYGYPRKTTPFLDSLKNESNFIYKKALSAGVYTDSSLPHILNIAERPDATLHIMSRKTNLFRMAREQDFGTGFITAQSRDSYSYLRSYLSGNDIDVYRDSLDFGSDAFTYAYDTVLIEALENFDFSRKHFIVLNMSGSHSPYTERVPEGFAPFPVETVVDEYDNTVAYTDRILSRIIRILSETGKKASVIFTSDHGQSVGLHSCGHGNINKESHYEVPFFIYTVNCGIKQEIRDFLTGNQWACHYDVARITAFYLGYETLGPENFSRRIVYVNGPELNGNSGYVKIVMDSTGIIKRNICH